MESSARTFRRDAKLGIFFVAAVGSAGVLAWLLGWGGSLGGGVPLSVEYGFAGGVERGAPVRVAGVRVGKVESIEFLSPEESANSEAPRPSVRLRLRVNAGPLKLVREDSRFYINIAGIIGERYVEVTPGSPESKVLLPGAVVRGIDPPRIDQLLSQGYGLFGKAIEFLERNEKPLSELFADAEGLLRELNKSFRGGDWKKFSALLENANGLAAELRVLAKKANDAEGRKVLSQLADLVERAHQIDKPTLKKFLQEEGIRARIF